MKKIECVAKTNNRVLKILEKEYPVFLYSAFNNALRKKDVIVNGKRISENIIVPAESKIVAYISDCAQKSLFENFYEDENILIINKKSGIEVCDGDFNIQNELAKSGKNVFAVHRLDRNTMGLVVFAKNQRVLNNLISAVKNKQIEKFYIAEVYGVPTKNSAILKGYLLKDKENSKVKVFKNPTSGADEITTEYSLVKTNGTTSLLNVKICDGKTHQIRAHLAYNNLPILGDGKYGKNEINKKFKLKTQNLRAYKIAFKLPDQNELNYLNNIAFKLKDEMFF